MPCEYVRDDERRIIRLIATEPVALLDITAVLDRQIAEGAWKYGTLVDLRHAILSFSDSRVLQEHLQRLAIAHGAPGPVALVTRTGVAKAQRYAADSAQHKLAVEVFWDVDDATRWLSAR